MKKQKKVELTTIKILKEDARKVKIWSAQRGMTIYQVISILINK